MDGNKGMDRDGLEVAGADGESDPRARRGQRRAQARTRQRALVPEGEAEGYPLRLCDFPWAEVCISLELETKPGRKGSCNSPCLIYLLRIE